KHWSICSVYNASASYLNNFIFFQVFTTAGETATIGVCGFSLIKPQRGRLGPHPRGSENVYGRHGRDPLTKPMKSAQTSVRFFFFNGEKRVQKQGGKSAKVRQKNSAVSIDEKGLE
ncbi:MAG: hypothetical protein IIX70_03305, partial [Oscillospiraceae bacterium]|nr:hypothetical protein [Oscillospiraceae bacterium]